MPLHLTDEISQYEALTMDAAYYVGFFDASGKLEQVEKYCDDSLFFRHEYSYRGDGSLRQHRLTKADGTVETYKCDHSGNVIK